MTSLNITTGITLLAVEPGIILTRALATFLHHQTRRFLFQSLRNARCLARQWTRERGLLLLPDELLTEVVKQLEWQDILQIRQTCQRLTSISKSLSVWQSVVGREPPELLWLECPIGAYSSGHLEFLFLRRKRAEVGYKMVAKGAAPHREVIPISMKDIAGPAHIVRGGRWLLLATHAGPIVYYDLEAETPIAQVLTPEHERGHLVSMAVDMDSTSPTLKFNLAASRKFVDFTAHVSTATVEVWQVNLILDGYERGIGLRAERLAMFDQEPPGECRSISLLGEQLAMAIFYSNHHTVYTVVVSWRSVSGPDYPKRMLHPSTEAMCLLQPDILLSTPCDTIDFTSCLSIPEVTTLPSHFLEIPETMPFLAVVPFQGFTPRPKSLSDCTIYSDSFRFVVHANRGMHTIIVRPKIDDTYHVETHKIMNTPEALYNLQIPVSGNLLPTWSQSGELRLQQFSWTEDEASSFPVARFKVSPRYEPSFQLFDIVSGRIIVPDAGGLSVFHLAPPLIPPITMRFGPWGNHWSYNDFLGTTAMTLTLPLLSSTYATPTSLHSNF